MNIVNSTNVFFNSVFNSAAEVIKETSLYDRCMILAFSAWMIASVGILLEAKINLNNRAQGRIMSIAEINNSKCRAVAHLGLGIASIVLANIVSITYSIQNQQILTHSNISVIPV